MLSDPLTLYKLMILYMLKHVKFQLTNAQLTDFFMQHDYTTYVTLQEALMGLEEAGLIRAERLHSSTRFELTQEGDDTLSFFGKNIPSAIVGDMANYLKENRFRLRDEVSVVADYYKSTNQDYIVHGEVREGKSCLISLSLSVPDREQAEQMSAQWSKKNQELYAYIMKVLMGS